MLAEEAQALY